MIRKMLTVIWNRHGPGWFSLACAALRLASILFSRELHVRNAELRAGLAKNQQALHAELEAAIARGISDGTLRSGISASDAAFLVIAILQGLALRWSLTGKRLDLVKEAGRLVRLAVEGFRA